MTSSTRIDTFTLCETSPTRGRGGEDEKEEEEEEEEEEEGDVGIPPKAQE